MNPQPPPSQSASAPPCPVRRFGFSHFRPATYAGATRRFQRFWNFVLGFSAFTFLGLAAEKTDTGEAMSGRPAKNSSATAPSIAITKEKREHLLPKPPVPMSEAGQYFPKLQEVQKSFMNDDIFLSLSTNLTDLLSEFDARHNEWVDNDGKMARDAIVSLEWLYYFVAHAQIERNSAGNNVYGLNEALMPLIKAISAYLNMEKTVEIAKTLSVDEKKLRTLHLVYYTNMINTMLEFEKVIYEKEKNDKEQEPVFDERYLRDYLVARDAAEALGGDVYTAQVRIAENFEMYGRMFRYQHRSYLTSRTDKRHFVKKSIKEVLSAKRGYTEWLLENFPNNGVLIREYMKKAGIVSDIEVASLIDEEVGRNQKTEHLFRGLPNAKKVEAWRQTKEKDKWIRKIREYCEDIRYDSIQKEMIGKAEIFFKKANDPKVSLKETIAFYKEVEELAEKRIEECNTSAKAVERERMELARMERILNEAKKQK